MIGRRKGCAKTDFLQIAGWSQDRRKHLRQLGDVGGDAPDLVTNSAGTLLIPVPISPPKMDGIEQFVRWGRRGSGGLAMHRVMRALIARWVALIAMLGLVCSRSL